MTFLPLFRWPMAIFLVALLSQCQPAAEQTSPPSETPQAAPSAKVTFIHTVFFWMKEGITEEEKAIFEGGLKKLTQTPSILAYYYGPPAQTPREVVDNSYDYAWILHFASKEDHDAYQVDPIHQEFIEKHGSLWQRVIVYDTVVK